MIDKVSPASEPLDQTSPIFDIKSTDAEIVGLLQEIIDPISSTTLTPGTSTESHFIVPSVGPFEIAPVPKVAVAQQKRKAAARKPLLLTSSPYKLELESKKIKQRQVGLKKTIQQKLPKPYTKSGKKSKIILIIMHHHCDNH